MYIHDYWQQLLLIIIIIDIDLTVIIQLDINNQLSHYSHNIAF